MNTKLLNKKEQILLLRKKGYSIKEIAKMLRCTIAEVCEVLFFSGVK